MKWPANAVEQQPKEKDTRLVRQFAWLPVYVSGWKIWLHWYEVLQIWDVRIVENVTIEGETLNFNIGKWIDLSKRLIQK